MQHQETTTPLVDYSVLPKFQKLKTWLKIDEKLRLHSLTFLPIFAPFSKIEKVARNGHKVKAIGLLFCEFMPLFQKSKKVLKMAEKLRL